MKSLINQNTLTNRLKSTLIENSSPKDFTKKRVLAPGLVGSFAIVFLVSAETFAQTNYQPQQTSTTQSPSVQSSFNQSSTTTSSPNGNATSQYTESQTQSVTSQSQMSSSTRNPNSPANSSRINSASYADPSSTSPNSNTSRSAAYRAALDECSSQAGLSAAEKQAMSNNQNSATYTGDGRPVGQTMGGSMDAKSPAALQSCMSSRGF